MKILLDNNSGIELIKHKLSSPILKIKDNYGRLLQEKPSYPTLCLLINNRKYYLHSGYPERTIQFDYTGSGSGSSTHWNPYLDYNPSPEFIMAKKINCNINFHTITGNFDEIKIEITYINIYTGVSIVKTNSWGSGDNWSGSFSGNHSLSQEEMNRLGGSGSSIRFRCRSMNNRGSSSVSIQATIKVSTTN